MKSLRIIQAFAIQLLLCEHLIRFRSSATKVCRGSSLGMTQSTPNDSYEEEMRYLSLKEQYTGCEYVDGNLEIVDLVKNHSYDLSFLSTIREVSGYVLIFNVLVPVIPLTNLRIIHGKTLYGVVADRTTNKSFTNSHMALTVASNTGELRGRWVGLEELHMPNLTEIVKGNAVIVLNKALCFEHTIKWEDIIDTVKGYKYESDSRDCGECHRSCSNDDGKPHCWGSGKKMCQRLTRTICDKNCEWRCFGKAANQCCHKECAGGCTNAEANNCWACRHFEDLGICKDECPKNLRYDQDLQKNVPQTPKYKYLQQCVDECPEHMLQENYACVIECSSNSHAPEGVCKPCYDNCPQKCEGLEAGDNANTFLHADNIKRFVNCSLVQGSLRFIGSSFRSDAYLGTSPVTMDQLSILESVKEVTGYVYIDSNDARLTSLSFLKNLKIIHGRNFARTRSSKASTLVVMGTRLERLDLNSLRHIRAGDVVIKENPKLCYAGTIAYWNSTLGSSESGVYIGSNREAEKCEEEGLVCHPQCSDVGCIGPGDDQCMGCVAFKYGKRCLEFCESIVEATPRLYGDLNTGLCTPCHPFCRDTCKGPGPHQCDACSNGRLDGSCVASCSLSMFINASGDCQPCHPNCDTPGCTGEGKHVGPGGCRSCDVAINATTDSGGQRLECLPHGSECEAGMYMNETLYKTEANTYKKGCSHCHNSCKTCSGHGSTHCTFCVGQECKSCSQQCVGCTGWSNSDCVFCRYLFVYEDFPNRETNKRFNCTDTCPDWAPNKIHANGTSLCVEDKYAPSRRQTAIICGVIIGGLLLIGFIIVCIMLLRRQLAKVEESKIRLTAKITGYVECEPLTPSNTKPDMAVLRLVKESDLRRGPIIGSGAFGTVYKGVWIPEGENLKIPVAIKVLQEGTTAGENRGMLEEARIMASVIHPCCVHVLAVCLTADMMLITPLMPLGCLLDYIRKNQNNIGSKSLLNWCTQIARGMVYLESRGIIHRDLAARNVLVQSATHVKITDFGLAKLVDDDGQFYAASGKVPIKWLALECIRQRIYTHKSDVWSFGVTIWELFTYGQRPYDNVSAKDVVDLLEKGERLSQPSICTIDIYMIMIKCWMLDAESRPTFDELESEFAKMARDPGRYLVIPNDSLMRLPSQPTDAVELLRNTSLALDGPEEIVTAEEYVNEMARRQSLQPPNSDVKMMKKLSTGEDTMHEGSLSQRRTSGTVPEGLRLKTTKIDEDEDDAPEDGPRYSPDPCSFSYPKEFPESAYLDERKDSAALPPAQGSFVNRLPLDETEYLQPQSAAPAAYLELMSEYEPTSSMSGYPKSANEDKKVDEQSSLLKSSSNAVSNPEYFNDTSPVNTRH